MTNGGDIIGDVAQGALTARALEPAHGEDDDGHSHEQACLNCNTPLVGSHCHACGQAAHVHRTLGAFFHDLLHGVFHFEGKIWRTLPLLAWNPGRLTREYIDGRRASYVSPIALFLFSVFLMFAVVKQFAGELNPSGLIDVNGTSIAAGVEAQTQDLAKLKAERARLVKAGEPTAAIDGQIAGQEEAIRVMSELKAADFSDLNARSDVPAIDRTLKGLGKNPGLVLYKLQNNAYKFSWALIPISVPFVWLLFAWRRRFHLYDHTVFVTYSLCFMTLLVVLITLGIAIGLPVMAYVAVLVPPWHMYRQLRGTYGLSVGSALWRTAALLAIAMTAMILFAMLLLAETGGA
ncbi:MAG: DUF3667 domain-containing protein [Sphingomonadales bacterium]|nr:DUF3667 domain-containing protein [Sphingomonadales bacterium]